MRDSSADTRETQTFWVLVASCRMHQQIQRLGERLQHFAKICRVNKLLRIVPKANEKTKPDQYTRFS